jgi:hypothetical protein
VIVSTLLIQYYGWTGFDPIASIFIAVLIAASVIPLVIDTGKVLALDVAQHADGITHALDEVMVAFFRRHSFPFADGSRGATAGFGRGTRVVHGSAVLAKGCEQLDWLAACTTCSSIAG